MLGVVLRVEHLDKALDLLVIGGVVLVEVADVQQDLGHLVDGVVTALRSGAVAGDTVHVDADLHTAAVAAIDAAVRRLGGDDELDLAAGILRSVEIFIDDGLPAHAVAVLLLHGADDHDLIALGDETKVLHDLRAVGSGGHAALLVGAAASVDDVVRLIALIRVVRPVGAVADADGIDVGIDGDDLLARAHPADDVAKLIDLDPVIAELLQLLLDAHDDALFFAAFTGDGDHVPQETAHVGTIALGRTFDCFKIHRGTLHYLFIPYRSADMQAVCGSLLLSYHILHRSQTNFFQNKKILEKTIDFSRL